MISDQTIYDKQTRFTDSQNPHKKNPTASEFSFFTQLRMTQSVKQ